MRRKQHSQGAKEAKGTKRTTQAPGSPERSSRPSASDAARARMNRRDFFKLTGMGGGALGLSLGSGCTLFPFLTPNFSATVLRPEDLVLLRFDFVNLMLTPSADGLGQSVVPNGAGQSFLIVNFQPQHIFEQAVLEKLDTSMPIPIDQTASGNPIPPMDARLAGMSRVVLLVPPEKTPLPFTSAGLLAALGSLEMSVAPNALPPPSPIVVRPISTSPVLSNGVIDISALSRTRKMLASGIQLTASTGFDVSQVMTAADSAATVAAATGLTPGPIDTTNTPLFPLPAGISLSPELQTALRSLLATAAATNPRPRQPLNGETVLELPFRLQISPNRFGGWAHNLDSAAGFKNGRFELWHTRLGVRDTTTGKVSETPSYLRTFRAIWTRDHLMDGADPFTYKDTSRYPAPNGSYDDVFNTPGSDPRRQAPVSLSASDRVQIVHLSSNFDSSTFRSTYTPQAIEADRLMLTTMGGWLDSRAVFPDSSPLTLIEWDHKASMGRDYFVKVVAKGRLYPWGHFAVLVKITERKFKDPDTTRNAAYLWQRFFIIVKEPTRTYPASWRGFPFQSITIKTLVTPNLAGALDDTIANPIKIDSNNAYLFKMQGVDVEGNVLDFAAPASWIPLVGSTLGNPDVVSGASIYEHYGNQRAVGFDGQRVAYSPARRPDDTTYETKSILFEGTIQSSVSGATSVSTGGSPANVNLTPPAGVSFPGSLPYLPTIASATFNVEAIRHLVGQNAPTPFSYHLKYLQSGLPGPSDTSHPNLGEMLFQLADMSAPIALDFSKKSDASGGFMAPSLNILGISRKSGPVSGTGAADLDTIAGNTFDPKTFLHSLNCLLFGCIKLEDIIQALGLGMDSAPNFITQAVDQVTGFLDEIAQLKQKLTDMVNTAGAIAGGVQMKIDAVRAQIDTIVTDINGLLSASNLDTAVIAAQMVISAFETLLDDLLAVLDPLGALPTAVLTSVKLDLQRRSKAIKDVLDGVNLGLMAFAQGLNMAKNLTVKLEWRAPLQGDSLGFFVPKPPAMGGGFLLSAEIRGKEVDGKPAGVDLVAGIEKFTINVFGSGDGKLVSIPFEHLLFTVESGKKPDIDVKFEGDGVGFDGILAFVETLSKLIPGGGFSDPPSISVSEEGIEAGFQIPIPSISVGVFAIENISIGAGFKIPFIGDPLTVNFNFCTREEPFVLTVMCIGGGGFFGIKLSPAGLVLLEAALEARAELSLDFGVASGSVSIAVGVYFRLEEMGGKQDGSLTGYIKIHGEVDVLGLITAAITLELDLIYEFSSGKLIGKATLTIEVSVFFFSFSVEVSCERKLAGSASDPTFLDQYPTAGDFQQYLDAFVLAA